MSSTTGLTHCFLCRELLLTPVILPCLHSFCVHCLSCYLAELKRARCLLNGSFCKTTCNPCTEKAMCLSYQSCPEQLERPKSPEKSVDGIQEEITYFPCPQCDSNWPMPSDDPNIALPNNYMACIQELHSCHVPSAPFCDYCDLELACSASHADPNGLQANTGSTFGGQSMEVPEKRLQKGERQQATRRCIECSDNLCDKCAMVHTRTKVTRQHRVVTYAEIKRGEHNTAIRCAQPLHCKRHISGNCNDHAAYFCRQCDVLICRECKVTSHEKHLCESLCDAMERYRNHIQKLVVAVKKRITPINGHIRFLTEYDEGIDRAQRDIEAQIEAQRESLHSFINLQANNLLSCVKTTCCKERQRSNEGKTMSRRIQSRFDTAVDFSESLLCHGRPAEILDLSRMVADSIKQTAKLSDKRTMNTKLNLCFVPGMISTDSLTLMMGKVDPYWSSVTKADTDSVLDDSCYGSNESGEMDSVTCKSRAKNNASFQCQATTDFMKPFPLSLDIHPNLGTIVVLDSDNQNVKLYDGQGHLLTSMAHLFGGPTTENRIIDRDYEKVTPSDACWVLRPSQGEHHLVVCDGKDVIVYDAAGINTSSRHPNEMCKLTKKIGENPKQPHSITCSHAPGYKAYIYVYDKAQAVIYVYDATKYSLDRIIHAEHGDEYTMTALRQTRFIRWLTNQKLMMIDNNGCLFAILNLEAGKAESFNNTTVDKNGKTLTYKYHAADNVNGHIFSYCAGKIYLHNSNGKRSAIVAGKCDGVGSIISMAYDSRTKTLVTGEKSGNIKTYTGDVMP